MYSCSGGTELDKAVKFRISRSAWCTFSRGEQIRGYVHRENEHRGAHFRGWWTNSLANLCAGARLRGGERIRCYTGAAIFRSYSLLKIELSTPPHITSYKVFHLPHETKIQKSRQGMLAHFFLTLLNLSVANMQRLASITAEGARPTTPQNQHRSLPFSCFSFSNFIKINMHRQKKNSRVYRQLFEAQTGRQERVISPCSVDVTDRTSSFRVLNKVDFYH